MGLYSGPLRRAVAQNNLTPGFSDNGQDHARGGAGRVQHPFCSHQSSRASRTLSRIRVSIIKREVAAADLHAQLVARFETRRSMRDIDGNSIGLSRSEWRRVQLGVAEAAALDTHRKVLREAIGADIDNF